MSLPNKRIKLLVLALASFACTTNLLAGPIMLPNTFLNGTTADADEINANFNAVKTAVDDNDIRVTELGVQVSAQLTDLTLLQGDVITGVAAGQGLTGGASSGDASLAVDASVVQSRVVGSCPTGQSIRVINFDGGVVCEIKEPLPFVSQRCPVGTSVIGFDDFANLICTGDTTGCSDADGDGFFADCLPLDCNDDSAEAFPGNPEVCDGQDNNCDGLIDEGGICEGAVEPGAGDLQIVEVMVNPSGQDLQREWVEILNLSNLVLDLNGCFILADLGGSLLTAPSGLAVGQHAVLANNTDSATNGGLPQVDISYASAAMFGNNGGQVAIGCDTVSPENVIDTFQYANSINGVSIQIDSSGNQCDTPAGNTYGDGDTGTPGAPNPVCP